jgi:hypothetical protein
MDGTASIVFLMFVVRCLVPLSVMLILSQILKRFGFFNNKPAARKG